MSCVRLIRRKRVVRRMSPAATNARATLAEIYGWFNQGFDTANLKDAKVLLGELNA